LRGVETLLRTRLKRAGSIGNADLLPFRNCVLNLKTKQCVPHVRELYLTWQLPFDYDPAATCKPVTAWLSETVGNDPLQVELLRAYLKAVITGRADFHRFLELIGPGGSGKGTFIRLAEALVGRKNVHVTELKHLETNRFESSNIYGKRLCVIVDAEKYSGDVSVLKAMTGGDSLRYEEKHKQCGQPFRYGGMVVIAANLDMGSSDYSSGLARRRITVRFERVVDAKDRRDLEAEFRPYDCAAALRMRHGTSKSP
jgi:putative DNA primase/helicase